MAKTLKSVTGKRPRCQYCDKELVPDTSTVELTGHLSEAPVRGDLCALSLLSPRPRLQVEASQQLRGRTSHEHLVLAWHLHWLRQSQGRHASVLFPTMWLALPALPAGMPGCESPKTNERTCNANENQTARPASWQVGTHSSP